MRQRTMAPTPDQYEPQDEKSLGIPTTIEVPCDALSVDEPPRIPVKIEVMKVRAKSTRRRVQEQVKDDSSSSSGRSSGESTTTSMQYDEYLYGKRTPASKKKRSVVPPKDVMVKCATSGTPPSPSVAGTTSVQREGKELVAIGSFLADGARLASHTTAVPVVPKKPAVVGCPSTRRNRQVGPLTRSSSVPALMKGVNAREAVDSFRTNHNRRLAQYGSIHQREIEIGAKLGGPPNPPERQPSEPSSLGGSALGATSPIVYQPSISMIFPGSSKPPPQPFSPNQKEKELSSRTMLTNTTSTSMTISTGSHPMHHHSLQDHSKSRSNMSNSMRTSNGDLIMGPSSCQEHSAMVGYVIEGDKREISHVRRRASYHDRSTPKPLTTSRPQKDDAKCYWRSAVDANSGRTYYYHKITNQTTWVKPTEMTHERELQQQTGDGSSAMVGYIVEEEKGQMRSRASYQEVHLPPKKAPTNTRPRERRHTRQYSTGIIVDKLPFELPKTKSTHTATTTTHSPYDCAMDDRAPTTRGNLVSSKQKKRRGWNLFARKSMTAVQR